MHTRVIIGVGAWLVGAGAATGGSLLAVSLLGQGIAAAPSQQLTVAAVNRALAREAAEARATPAAAPPAASPSLQPSRVHHHRHRAAPSAPRANPGAVLTSEGGTVVARCWPAGTYLLSWSPQQGYEAGDVIRGPAVTARVTFTSWRRSVTMVVSCADGTPSVTSTVRTRDE